MMKEGIGDVAPKPHRMIIPDYVLQVLLREAKARAEYRQYEIQRGEWAKGLQNDVVIHGVGKVSQVERPILVGLIGEWASCEYINKRVPAAKCAVDLLRKERGDYGIDITAFGLHLQVKTRQRSDSGNLIRVIDEFGRRKPLAARAFVFCEWSGDKVVSLLGWQWTKDIKVLPVRDAVRGRHKNICVADWRLLCMSRLGHAISAKKELSC